MSGNYSVCYENDETAILSDHMGLRISREEWEELKSSIDRYFENDPDDSIEKERHEFYMRHFKESRGYVYLMLRSSDGLYKIGMAKDPQQRMKALERHYKCRFELLHTMFSRYYGNAESWMHRRFNVNLAQYNEWFNLSRNDVDWICNIEDIDKLAGIK